MGVKGGIRHLMSFWGGNIAVRLVRRLYNPRYTASDKTLLLFYILVRAY